MRINGIEVRGDDYDGEVRPGRYFLVRTLYIDRNSREVYDLCREPGRTNVSHEQRLSGWLGETNNVSRYAEGAVEVYQTTAGHLRCRRIDAEELLDEVSPNVEIEEAAG